MSSYDEYDEFRKSMIEKYDLSESEMEDYERACNDASITEKPGCIKEILRKNYPQERAYEYDSETDDYYGGRKNIRRKSRKNIRRKSRKNIRRKSRKNIRRKSRKHH
jgi:hypothetical protein